MTAKTTFYKLVLLRHGQSLWNKDNLFTGWKDIDLSTLGIQQAKDAGQILKKNKLCFDFAFCSVLKRSVNTLFYVLESMDIHNLPTKKSWKLNEKHYGALQGMNKDEARKKYGKDKVHMWRRSFDTPPPLLEKDVDFNLQQYSEIKNPVLGESLKDTQKRVLDFWHSDIAIQIKQNKTILIVAHGNSLRALMQYLEDLSEQKLLDLNIPTGEPILYTLDSQLKFIKSEYLK
ncbi:MAG: 2,3-diphosphoglycerate-dependent phosphoglycerate mutase [Bdellovibrionales bacterium]|nr:2,3-diphosphoglycerate-dependent phosphoglycerate mutase [Bdellovibrionales bacterium]